MITFAFSDDNGDDNVMSGYDRLKRWREKNRGLVNLRQREYRSDKTRSRGVIEPVDSDAKKTKIQELRALIVTESSKSTAGVPVSPQVFRDDYGRVITEVQWKRLQESKEKAKTAGYVIDDYSQ